MRISFDSKKLVVLTLGLLLLPTLAEAGDRTHVGTQSRNIINLHTGVLPNDNTGGFVFSYDRGPVFSVPAGFSFVVTDIAVRADSTSFASTDQHWVFVNIDNAGSRTLDARWTGGGGYDRSLTTGVVMPAGTTPTARNLTYSTHDVTVQLQGYFVKGEGLPANTSRF